MRTLALLAAAALAACASPSPSTPPPQWATGGSPILIPEARWQDGGGTVVDIRQDGAVLLNGGLLFSLDPAGRVYDQKGAGVAVLLTTGRLGGPDQTDLGVIGVGNAAPPGRNTAWLSIQPSGEVVYADSDGSRQDLGAWKGCEGPARRTCTLVTHLVTLHRVAVQNTSTAWVGAGAAFYR